MKRVGIIGANGRLGRAIVQRYKNDERVQVIPFFRQDFDLAASDSVRSGLVAQPCDVIINCAALTEVDYCETHQEEADRLNGYCLGDIAWAAEQHGAQVIHFSTDYVFDGKQPEPYVESDPVHPVSYYGKSKLLGEHCLTEHSDRHLIFRISWLFGATKPAFPEWILAKAMETESLLPVVGDKWACPTLAEDVARLLEPVLLGPTQQGVFHLCNRGSLSWSNYARLILDIAKEMGAPIIAKGIEDVAMESIPTFVAQRPVHSSFSTQKFEQTFALKPLSTEQAVREHLVRELQLRAAMPIN